jgi:hypothetical protein
VEVAVLTQCPLSHPLALKTGSTSITGCPRRENVLVRLNSVLRVIFATLRHIGMCERLVASVCVGWHETLEPDYVSMGAVLWCM